MIPKIIHYCWLSGDPVPEDIQLYMASWVEVLHDYEFRKWDFSVFNKESSCWVSEAFDCKKYAFAADYIRLFAVYNYGGIYLDMDIQVLKRFDDLLSNSYMFAYENIDKTGIEAGCFGAEKENPFLKKCLEYYENRHFKKPDGSFDTPTPLPQIMLNILNKNNYNYLLLDENHFTAKSFETGIINITDNTYCIHHFAGSWLDEMSQYTNQYRLALTSFLSVKWAGRIAKFLAVCKINGFMSAIKDTLKWLKNSKKL